MSISGVLLYHCLSLSHFFETESPTNAGAYSDWLMVVKTGKSKIKGLNIVRAFWVLYNFV